MEIQGFLISNDMDIRKFNKRVVGLIVFILIINFLAMKFHWYVSLWWFDMPMHFLGGFWLGLATLWLISRRNFVDFNGKYLFLVLFSVFFFGFLWEIFEILVNNNLAKNPFDLYDTISDMFFDMAGGLTAILYFLRRIMINTQNNI